MFSAKHECDQAYMRATLGLSRQGPVTVTTSDGNCNKTTMSMKVRHMLFEGLVGRRCVTIYNNIRENTVTVVLEEYKGVTEDDLNGTFHREFTWNYEPIGGGQFRLTKEGTYPEAGKISTFGAFEPPLPEDWADMLRLLETDAIREMVCVC